MHMRYALDAAIASYMAPDDCFDTLLAYLRGAQYTAVE